MQAEALTLGRVTVLQGMSTQVIKRALEQSVAKQHSAAEAAHKGAAGAEAAPSDKGSGCADDAHGAGARASAATAPAPAPAAAASAQACSSAGGTSTPWDAEPQPQGCAEGMQKSRGSHLAAERCQDPQACRLHPASLLFGARVLRCGCRYMTFSLKHQPDAVVMGAPADEEGEEEAQRRALAETARALNMDPNTLGRALLSTGLRRFEQGMSQAEWSDWLSAFQPFHDASPGQGLRPLNVSRSPCADTGESCTSSRVHCELKGTTAPLLVCLSCSCQP